MCLIACMLMHPMFNVNVNYLGICRGSILGLGETFGIDKLIQLNKLLISSYFPLSLFYIRQSLCYYGDSTDTEAQK